MFGSLRPVSHIHHKLCVRQIPCQLQKEMLDPHTSEWEHALLRAVESPIDHLVLGAPCHLSSSLHCLLSDASLPGLEVPGNHIPIASGAATFYFARGSIPPCLFHFLPVFLPSVPLPGVNPWLTITMASNPSKGCKKGKEQSKTYHHFKIAVSVCLIFSTITLEVKSP